MRLKLTPVQARAIESAVWLVGVGLLLTWSFWPGILFLLAATTVTEGVLAGRGWYALQGGYWLAGIGVWALFGYNLVVLFSLIALSGLIAAFFPPPNLVKPEADPSLIDDAI